LRNKNNKKGKTHEAAILVRDGYGFVGWGKRVGQGFDKYGELDDADEFYQHQPDTHLPRPGGDEFQPTLLSGGDIPSPESQLVVQRFRSWVRLHHGKFKLENVWKQTELDISQTVCGHGQFVGMD
jgi:hypothetical protein